MRCAVVAAFALAACGHAPPRHVVIASDAPAAYPGVLHPPRTLAAPDFMVRQSLTIHTTRDGKPVDAELDAVLQKRGPELLVLGLGPMDAKAFTLTQRESTIEFEQFMGPPMAFSPRDMILDIHRVFFKRLPGAAADGTRNGELDGEHVEETWQDGELRHIVYTRPADKKLKGSVKIDLGPGCKPARCEPATATVHNEWFSYTVEIANDPFEWL